MEKETQDKSDLKKEVHHGHRGLQKGYFGKREMD